MGKRALLVIVAIFLGLAGYLAGFLAFRWMLIAFPLPKDYESLLPIFEKGVSLVGSSIGPLVTFFGIGVKRGEPPVPTPLPANPSELPRQGERVDASGEITARNEYLTGRVGEYKSAWIKRGQDITALTTENNKLQQDLFTSEMARQWCTRWLATFAVAFFISVMQFITSVVSSGVSAWYAVHVSTKGIPPWPVNFAQALLLIAVCLILPHLVYREYVKRSGNQTSAGSALVIGGIGTVVAGLMFFLQVSPELLQFVLSGPPQIEITSWLHPPFYIYLLTQRVILLPTLAAISCLLAHYMIERQQEQGRIIT